MDFSIQHGRIFPTKLSPRESPPRAPARTRAANGARAHDEASHRGGGEKTPNGASGEPSAAWIQQPKRRTACLTQDNFFEGKRR